MDAAACEHLRATLGIDVVRVGGAARGAARARRRCGRWRPGTSSSTCPIRGRSSTPPRRRSSPAACSSSRRRTRRAFGLRVLGARWPHVDAPRHLFLIPHGTLAEHARGAGLEPVELTHADPGGRHWNAFGWHYALRRPGIPPLADHAAQLAGRAVAAALAPVERRGMRGAAYTLVLRKRS